MKIDCAGVGVRVGGNFLFVVVAVVSLLYEIP